MKIYHYSLMFIIFLFSVIIKVDIAIGKLKSMETEKAKLSSSLDIATTDAINLLAKSGSYGMNAINKNDVVNTFFTSFYSSMGIISDKNAQTELEMYIPVILLCDVDGFYVYYYEEYKAADGRTYSERIWTEKIPYYYQDEDFIYRFTLTDQLTIYDIHNLLGTNQKVLSMDYHEIGDKEEYANFRAQHGDSILFDREAFLFMKKGAIIKQLEDVMAFYTSKHNAIARRNGITYSFSFPSGQEEEWAYYLDDVSLLVFFQGYPYGADRNYTFNKIASAGANVMKKPVYYVEKKSWYYLAHKEGCEKRMDNLAVLEETFESIEDCAKIGAYCCDCIEYGARVPEIR